MRVVFVEHKEMLGGGQQVLLNLLAEWQRQRVALAPLVVASPRAAILPRARARGMTYEAIDLGAIEKARGLVWNFAQRIAPTRRLVNTLRTFRADVVCANGAYSFLACALAARWARVPVVWLEHNMTLPNDLVVRALLAQAAHIVVVSEVIRAQFLALTPRARDKITIVHNGVALEEFLVAADGGARVKRELGWSLETRVIGTVARLSPEKGIAYFLDAAWTIAREFADARFLVVGDGSERRALEARAAALGLECLRFVGFRENVIPYLSAMDVAVFPYLAEGFPLAVLEAMAAARPVVAADAGGVREQVVNGETGVLVPPRDPESIARAVSDLLRDEPRRRAWGACGRARVREQFTLRAQAEKMYAVLARAAS